MEKLQARASAEVAIPHRSQFPTICHSSIRSMKTVLIIQSYRTKTSVRLSGPQLAVSVSLAWHGYAAARLELEAATANPQNLLLFAICSSGDSTLSTRPQPISERVAGFADCSFATDLLSSHPSPCTVGTVLRSISAGKEAYKRAGRFPARRVLASERRTPQSTIACEPR